MSQEPRRLILDAPDDEDLAALAGWLRRGDPLTVLYSGGQQAVTPAALRSSIDNGRETYLIAVTRADRRRIGFVSYRRTGSPDAYDVGIGIADPAEWGSGFGPEAFVLLLDLLFHQLGARRVQVTTSSVNRHVLTLLHRGGFTVEGVLRETVHLDGRWHDSIIASMLRGEYYAAEIFRPIPDIIPVADKDRAHRALRSLLSAQGGIGQRLMDADSGQDDPDRRADVGEDRRLIPIDVE